MSITDLHKIQSSFQTTVRPRSADKTAHYEESIYHEEFFAWAVASTSTCFDRRFSHKRLSWPDFKSREGEEANEASIIFKF